MSLWSPTHVQFTVLRARNLLAKGKNGNNDVFVTIQLGKEKYQTSTIKTAVNPEWFEECDLPIPHMRSEIHVSLYHRGVLSDDFLGFASIPLWEHKITETASSSWVSLHNKPNKTGDDKYRGELEIKLVFHCQSHNDVMSHGLKKRSSSIRNLATAFGDKFKLTRSRSFRENHRDPESGKRGKSRMLSESSLSQNRQETHQGMYGYPYHHSHSNHPVHFSALDVSRAPWGIDPTSPDALSRSYSMSAALIKTMSLERGKLASYQGSMSSVSNVNSSLNNNSGGGGGGSANLGQEVNSSGVLQVHSQSLYNLPGNRRSCADVPLHHPSPPPYDTKLSSKDDSALLSSRNSRQISDNSSSIRVTTSTNFSPFEPVWRERAGIYESIKEKTEPENSASSTSDPESVPMPKSHIKMFSPRNASSKSKSSQDRLKQTMTLPFIGFKTSPSDQQAFNSRDSGILDDRSPSLGNSLEGSIATTTDGTSNGSKTRGQTGPAANGGDQSKSEVPMKTAARGPKDLLLLHQDREMIFNGSSKPKKKVVMPGQFISKENDHGELVVRKRSRGQRDRLRQIRQGNRRYTVQGLEQGASGLYDDSMSEPTDSSRNEVSEDLMSTFKTMTKEELLRVVITSKAQMIRKDQYIKDLENYIDDLLVRVMETTPRLLSRQSLHRL